MPVGCVVGCRLWERVTWYACLKVPDSVHKSPYTLHRPSLLNMPALKNITDELGNNMAFTPPTSAVLHPGEDDNRCCRAASVATREELQAVSIAMDGPLCCVCFAAFRWVGHVWCVYACMCACLYVPQNSNTLEDTTHASYLNPK